MMVSMNSLFFQLDHECALEIGGAQSSGICDKVSAELAQSRARLLYMLEMTYE